MREGIDVSDVFYDLLALSHMIEAIRLIVHEMDYTHADGSRNDDLDRVSALIQIAGREANRQVNVAQMFDGPRKWERGA